MVVQSPEVTKFYATNGYYFPDGCLPGAMVRDAMQKVTALEVNPPKEMAHPWNLKAHLLADWIYDLCTHPAILDAAEAILGPDILMQAADMFVKPAHTTRIINWHQDANYWGLDPFELVTGWIALTDVFPENGCMRYMPGTHLQDKLEHIETYSENSALTRGQEIPGIDESHAVPVALKAGQMSMHHCLLAHASGPNTTDASRIGLAVRYIPTHVRQTTGPAMSGILVRGVDEYRHFQSDPIPSGSFTPETIAAHDRSMAPHAATNYSTA